MPRFCWRWPKRYQNLTLVMPNVYIHWTSKFHKSHVKDCDLDSRPFFCFSSAHSRFTSMYRIVFPNGIDSYDLVGTKPSPIRSLSKDSVSSTASQTSLIPFGNVISRWFGGPDSTVSAPKASPSLEVVPENAIDHLIFSGVAFGSFREKKYTPS